jgi:hypothetical protein
MFYYIHLALCHGPIPAIVDFCQSFLSQSAAVFTETIPKPVESLCKYLGLLRVCHASVNFVLLLFIYFRNY